MRIFEEELEHATMPHRVRLAVYELGEGDVSLGEPGFLVAEERAGAGGRVVATLGVYAEREPALARARARGEELRRQRYRPVPDAA
jgi:hypothetical protein